jgi:hypothetical protein
LIPSARAKPEPFSVDPSVPPGGERIREVAAPPVDYRPFIQAGCCCHRPPSSAARSRRRLLLKRKWPTRRLERVALSWRRDRLTAIGRRRSDTAKKKCSDIAKKKYWRAASPTDKNKFRNQRARESAGVKNKFRNQRARESAGQPPISAPAAAPTATAPRRSCQPSPSRTIESAIPRRRRRRGSHCALLAPASSHRGPRLARGDSQRAWLTEQYRPFLKPGAVAIDPLARRRDRLTASGRRRGTIAKKKSAKKKSYWARGAGAPADKINFRNQTARESAGEATALVSCRALLPSTR